MEWFRQKLGLTPSPPQQSPKPNADNAKNNEESPPPPVNKDSNDVDDNNDDQSLSKSLSLKFEAVEYENAEDSDDDVSLHRLGMDLLTQQPEASDGDKSDEDVTDDDDDDNYSEMKESSSVDIDNNNIEDEDDQNSDGEDDSKEHDVHDVSSARKRRMSRAKRQTGDLLSKLPSTPTPQSTLATAPNVAVASLPLVDNERNKPEKMSPLVTTNQLQESPIKTNIEGDSLSRLPSTTQPRLTTAPNVAMASSPLLDNDHIEVEKISPLATTKQPLESPMKTNTEESEEIHFSVHSPEINHSPTSTTSNNHCTTPLQLKSPTPLPKKEHPLLHQLIMKQTAINRSIIHLSDNSYSFVYDEVEPPSTNINKTTQRKPAAKAQDFISWSPTRKDDINIQSSETAETRDNNIEQPNNDGLPFIGPGLKDQYDTLFKLLRDGLLGTYNDDDDNDIIESAKPKIQANVSAILMGPRGHGKSLLLERCLAELSRMAGKRKERLLQKLQGRNGDVKQHANVNELHNQSSFRVVRINGLLYQGDNAVACTREIARQINHMSRIEKQNRSNSSLISRRNIRKGGSPMEECSSPKRQRTGNDLCQLTPSKLSPTKPATPISPKSPNPQHDEAHQFRLRKTGFNTNISLLDEALRTARIDGIPILIVLEELDTFLAGGKSYSMTGGGEKHSQMEHGGSNDRQLLLYHLLDRVADHRFLISLVGMTTNLSTINQLEKRVQSRAEGTSKVIYFGHGVSGGYDACVDTLLGKFYTPPLLSSTVGNSDGMALLNNGKECTEQTEMMNLRHEVDAIFRGNQSESKVEEEFDEEINDISLVQHVLRRNYEMHMEIRWFCGLLDVALSLLMADIDEQMLRCSHETLDIDVQVPKLSPNHIAHALVMMGASLDDIASNVGRPGIPHRNELEQIRWGQLIGDPNHYSALVGTNPRLVALLDLSGPQIAILLAARRIMARDEARSTIDEDAVSGGNQNNNRKNLSVLSVVAPLTYKRIEDEYTTSFVNSERYTISSDRYPPHVLYRSFMDLMELDLVRLKKEHCERGALQYEHLGALSTGANITNLPLFVNLEWELDFLGILKAGLLKCSTSLREWGLKIMS